MILSKEIKNNYYELLKSGDIGGLEYLEKEIENNFTKSDITEDIFDLVNFVIELNGAVAIGETFSGVFSENYDMIHELYLKMKTELEILVFEKGVE